jgi:hypothetical protein
MNRPDKTHKTNGQPTQKYMLYLMLHQRREACDAELAAWIEQTRARAARRPNVADWTIGHARDCADGIRAFDKILHRHGFCPRNPRDCFACEALLTEGGIV